MRRLWIWALVVALGTAVGMWVGARRRQAEREAALELARRVVGQVASARDAHGRGEPKQAQQVLERARKALEEAEGGTRTSLYATVLTELAAMGAAAGADPQLCRGLLARAWEVPDLGADLKVRIARDAGALAAAAGDREAARLWYGRVLELIPDDARAKRVLATLDLLERSGP